MQASRVAISSSFLSFQSTDQRTEQSTPPLRGISLRTSRRLPLRSRGHLLTASFSPQMSMEFRLRQRDRRRRRRTDTDTVDGRGIGDRGRVATGRLLLPRRNRECACTPISQHSARSLGWTEITHVNGSIQPAWGRTRNIHWMNGSTRVQGWLMLPKDFVPSRTYPLIVSVHGGPPSACISHWDEGFTGAASAMGYFVRCPNPRGSYGQGE